MFSKTDVINVETSSCGEICNSTSIMAPKYERFSPFPTDNGSSTSLLSRTADYFTRQRRPFVLKVLILHKIIE